ncbi:unnamed protein product [Rotaria sordida]|uniref:Uncharacterized protein n=2 Tax=Rotaria sordida TaxID=392033 RepID=A0A820C835_9BILA|nr:unnamed protein product [Rotaria sordida]
MNRFGDIDVSFKRLPPVYGYHAEKLVSLEKALQPIEAHINELPRFIKVAKDYCHFPSEHGLSHDQSAAVYIYTMEWGETTLYRVLNEALRAENRKALRIWFPYLKLFDTALDLLPTVKEVVWRGVPIDIVVNGKKISGYTEHESEDEIILRMGSRFLVKSDVLEQSNGSHLVHLIELGDNNDQPLASAMDPMHLSAVSSNTSTSSKLIILLHEIIFCMIHMCKIIIKKYPNTD